MPTGRSFREGHAVREEPSADEIENSSAALRTLDQDHDGSLTPDELLPGPLTIRRR